MDERVLNPLGAGILPDASIVKTPKNESIEIDREPIINREVTQSAAPWYKKIDGNSIVQYVVNDVVKPNLRDLAFNSIMGALSIALYQTPKAFGGTKPKVKDPNYKAFGAQYRGNSYGGDDDVIRKTPYRADAYREKIDIYNLVLASDDPNDPSDISASEKGLAALDAMKARLNSNPSRKYVTVADLYDILNLGNAPATMRYWGWDSDTDFDPPNSTVTIRTIRGESYWVLRMAQAKQVV